MSILTERGVSAIGEIVYLNVAGQPVIMLNSQRVAADILDRRAATNSGRPRLIVGSELMCNDMLLALESHNDRCVNEILRAFAHVIQRSICSWRRQRRAVHEGFNRSALSRFYPALFEDATRLAISLSQDPSSRLTYYQNYGCSTVLSVTYDRPLHGKPEDEAMRLRIDTFVKKLTTAIAPGAHFVEVLPWMLSLPNWMARWKRHALHTYHDTTEFFLGLVDDVDARVVSPFIGLLHRACL